MITIKDISKHEKNKTEIQDGETNHDTINIRNGKELGVVSRVTTDKSINGKPPFSLELVKKISKSLSFSSTFW